MAAPVNRRSGYSRRAQYSIFLTYAAGVLGALVGVCLLIVSHLYPSAFSGVTSLAADATAPAANVVSEGRAVGRGTLDTLWGFLQTGSRHAKLERELTEAKSRLVEMNAISAENRRLKQMLKLADDTDNEVAVARLVSSTNSSTRRFATLDAGARQGIGVGMPVRSATGLIGRVLEVGTSTSRVMLITDSESQLPVRRVTDGVSAIAEGKGDGTLRIRLINLGINPLRKNDVFVTSGSGGLYRPGTPTAIVTSLLRDGAIARVLSDPGSNEFVMVERAWAPMAIHAQAAQQDDRTGKAPLS